MRNAATRALAGSWKRMRTSSSRSSAPMKQVPIPILVRPTAILLHPVAQGR